MIKRLSQETVRRISSGQIASSPKAVLKELIENAVDSAPREIRVVIDTPFSFSVSDDGVGIDYRELPLTVERFTTSKISEFSDLNRLRTYGFRGEALYAISQVSFLTIKSSPGGQIGGRLVVRGGKVEEYSPIPYRKGTTVEVRELFFNTPVRRKSVGRKGKSSLENLSRIYALANPNVTFRINDKFLPASSLEERVLQVFGRNWDFLKVEGNFVNVFFNREKKGVRQIFVNRRPVELPQAEKLLLDLGIKSFILFIEVPPDLVDPNVTSTKERVLIESDEYLKELEELLSVQIKLPKFHVVREEREIEYRSPIKIIGSDGTVLIAHDAENYYFFDLHLIHERVNYEELLEKLRKGEVRKVPLSKPLDLDKELLEKLKELGIGFKENGERLLVYEIPEILSVEDVLNLKKSPPETVAAVACRRAVKSGYRIVNVEEMEELFNRYLLCKDREFCPHGRPIYYKMKKQKIYSQLGRKLKL